MEEIRNDNHEENFHPAPNWLTVSYLEPIIRRYKQDAGLNILDMNAKSATAKGENYASIMTRIKVDYLHGGSQNVQTEYFIVKMSYESNTGVSHIFEEYQTGYTEMIMYDKILPTLTSLLDDTEQSEKLVAKTIHVDYEHSAIIFEDLAVINYGLGDRLTGFNLECARLVMRKLAKFHATAAVFNERQPGVLTKLDHGMFNRHTRIVSPMFESLIRYAGEFAEECPELGSIYGNKLKKLQERVMEYTERVYEPQPDEFNTLTHGDLWVNNIMLRNKTEKSDLDMLLIDFQFCAWASPAVDLYYFFSTSLQPKVRMEYQDGLIHYYHSILIETLRSLGFGGHIPTLRRFVLQLERGKFMAVTSSLVSQAVVLNEEKVDADASALVLDNERGRKFRKLLYKNKKLQDNVKQLLPHFDNWGLLDVMD